MKPLNAHDLDSAILWAKAQGWEVVTGTWEKQMGTTHAVCPITALFYANGGNQVAQWTRHEGQWLSWATEAWGRCPQCKLPVVEAFNAGVDDIPLPGCMKTCAADSAHLRHWEMGARVAKRHNLAPWR